MAVSDRVGNKSPQVAALLIMILLGGTVTAAGQTPSGPPVTFRIIAAGGTSAVHMPARVVVRGEADWLALWRQHAGPNPSSAPVIDFDRSMVIAIFAGEVRAPAAIAIARITREPDHLVVSYTFREVRPDADGSVLSAPFAIAQLARSPLPVSFVQIRTQPVLRRVP